MVPEGASPPPGGGLAALLACSEPLVLPDPCPPFTRVSGGRVGPDGPLVFRRLEMPLGPEDEVAQAFEDRRDNVVAIRNVSPALQLAFDLETRRRLETERLVREATEAREREERRAAMVRQLGDGEGRREMAKIDFEQAARAALRVGEAEYLTHRPSAQRGEMVVRFRLDGQRFECCCDLDLHITDAGICLTDHDTDEKGDTYFTLESLPSVIREAARGGKLVVWRH